MSFSALPRLLGNAFKIGDYLRNPDALCSANPAERLVLKDCLRCGHQAWERCVVPPHPLFQVGGPASRL